jgi:putative (di)nucleoside polyphosphate hydrolase
MNAARDPARYRPNVGLALFNRRGEVFYGRRIEKGPETNSDYLWQLPQGGVDAHEDVRTAALRELDEEVGVDPSLVEVIEELPDWLFYDFPPEVMAYLGRKNRYLGQRQKWFALRFLGQDSDIHLDRHKPEFDAWRWGPLADAPRLIIPFKRATYEEVVRRFLCHTE